MLDSGEINHPESEKNIAYWSSLETTIHKIMSVETNIAFAYNSLQSESMARATPANMPD